MKTSIPQQISIFCWFVVTAMSCFQLGVSYAVKPYRAWFSGEQSGVAFTQIGVQQSQTMLLASYAAVGFSLLGLCSLLWHLLRRKEPIQLLVPARGKVQ